MTSARVRLPEGLEGLLRSKMETCIYEANLGTDDTEIAKRYLLDHWAQIDIAAELGCCRTTVHKRVHWILEKVELTAKELRLTKVNIN